MPEAELFAGASESLITPPTGASLLGPVQLATGVHDELFARALVLSDRERSTAIVCLDLVGLDLAFCSQLQMEIRRRAGVDSVLLSCSHTHSAPFTIPWSVLGWEWVLREGKQWQNDLATKVTEAVCKATARLQKAQLRAGRASVQIGFNRRSPTGDGVVMLPNPAGVVVPWVDVLRVDATDGTPLAVLFSHAAHPVIVHAASTLVSADYPGYATAMVRQHFGNGAVAMFAQACGANINAEPLRGGFEAAERVGKILGEAAVLAATQAEPIASSPLRITSVELDLPPQDLPSAEECESVLREFEDQLAVAENDNAANQQNLWYLRDTVLCLRDLADKTRRGEPQLLPLYATALSVGDAWCLLAMTHEVFAEYQLWVDEVSPYRNTMMLAYTNGCESYIPTDTDLALGGYEATSFPEPGAALRYPYRVAVRPGVEGQIKEMLLSMLTNR